MTSSPIPRPLPDLFGQSDSEPPRPRPDDRDQRHRDWLSTRRAAAEPYTPTPEELAVFEWEQRPAQ